MFSAPKISSLTVSAENFINKDKCVKVNSHRLPRYLLRREEAIPWIELEAAAALTLLEDMGSREQQEIEVPRANKAFAQIVSFLYSEFLLTSPNRIAWLSFTVRQFVCFFPPGELNVCFI